MLLAVLLLAAVVAAGGPAGAWREDPTAPRCLRLAVPLYTPPEDVPAWSGILMTTPAPAYVVLNPDSGPGAALVAGYRDLAERLSDRGVTPLGYVPTGYGQRDRDAVTAEIDRWRDWYGVSGIFLDEASSEVADVPLYQSYADHVRAADGRVALNPGIVPAAPYLDFADVVVTFEGSADDYLAGPPPDQPGRAGEWHLVHSAASRETGEVLAVARRQGVELLYVTTDVMPNPWDAVVPDLPAQARAACPLPAPIRTG